MPAKRTTPLPTASLPHHRDLDWSDYEADGQRMRDCYLAEKRAGFRIAWDREDSVEPCERGTEGCCVDHTASPEHDSCDTW